MKRTILALAMVCGCTATVLRADTKTLTSLAAIHALTNAQAAAHLPVAFEATVTHYRAYERTLFVQDGDIAIFVLATTGLELMPGDRVMVRGTTSQSFRPIVVSNSIERLRHGSMPKAVAADFDDLIQARYDGRLVTVRALVRSADVTNYSLRNARLQMLMDGGTIEATLDTNDAEALKSLLDAEVEITGVDSGKFDGKMQQTGIDLHIASLANIRVLKRAQTSPWALPVTPMGEILTTYHVVNRTQRVRVQGTITYYQPGSAVVLQQRRPEPVDHDQEPQRSAHRRHCGCDRNSRRARWVSDPDAGRSAGQRHPIADSAARSPPGANSPRAAGCSTWFQPRGRWSRPHEKKPRTSTCCSPTAIFFQPSSAIPSPRTGPRAAPALPPMKEIPVGATVQVTGVCVLEDSNPFDANVPFDLMMRSYDDIAVIAWPSWMSVRNLVRVISVMLVIILGVTAWGWMLKRKVHRQSEVLAMRSAAEAEAERHNARLQQQRSRILEDINGRFR